jgi:ATPase subunit of ABC transporter with duplicated ATPase domains
VPNNIELTETQLRGMLGMFGLMGEKVFQESGTLSGGEKTKLSLATLMVGRNNLLLLDEPTNNLDPASRAQVLDALRRFAGAVVLVTHDPGAVEALTPDKVIVLPDGTEDLWSSDILTSCNWPDRTIQPGRCHPIAVVVWRVLGHTVAGARVRRSVRSDRRVATG